MRTLPALLALTAVLTFSLAASNSAHAEGGGGFGGGAGGIKGGHGGGHGGHHGGHGGHFGGRGFGGPGLIGGYGLGFGLGVGGLYNGLDFYNDYRVPYFAAHPPVYYSHPVPRTYGHSPFAYPPHFRTPEYFAPIAPVTITNPYVPASEAPASKEETKSDEETVSAPVKAAPLMVYNPFVIDSSLARSER